MLKVCYKSKQTNLPKIYYIHLYNRETSNSLYSAFNMDKKNNSPISQFNLHFSKPDTILHMAQNIPQHAVIIND